MGHSILNAHVPPFPAMTPQPAPQHPRTRDVIAFIREQATELGFQQAGVTHTKLDEDERHLQRWVALGRHGRMDYMARHGTRRTRPAELVPGTVSVISVRMDYWPAGGTDPWALLADGRRGYISRYALGRDYHKLMRRRLQRLADALTERIGPFGYRVFVDSAPVLEKALARNAGLGWIGKHTNLINRHAGSWFFLGEIYTDLPLPVDAPASAHCGTCTACLDICPTRAIVAPYELDARLCIAYLTIENPGPIPEALRPAIGNRIYGCDDCQLICPWNKFAADTREPGFEPRESLDGATLAEYFAWTEDEWDERTRGSAIRRIGYRGWLRNIAVALGNAPTDGTITAALRTRAQSPDTLVREHVQWALARHGAA